MPKNFTKILEALQNIADFSHITPSDADVTRLGGLTNAVYQVTAFDKQVVVRIAGEGTQDYINREIELHNADAAQRAGIAPAILWADKTSGTMITHALQNIETMTPALFKARKGAPARAGIALAKLHGSKQKFIFEFDLFKMIDHYLKILSTKDVALPEGYHHIVAAALPIRHMLQTHHVPLAPCHCDPLCENFLDDGHKMWLVDWEYSGMNDPHWDLGDLAVEAQMDEAQEDELLHAYFARPPTAAEKGRVVVYKALCDLLWTLWGLIQLADQNPASDFRAYADERFGRCKSLMNNPSFNRHLAAIAG